MRFYKNILLDGADVMTYEMFVLVKIEHDWMPKRCKGSDKIGMVLKLTAITFSSFSADGAT